jgi:hypothetical protein
MDCFASLAMTDKNLPPPFHRIRPPDQKAPLDGRYRQVDQDNEGR